MVDGYSRVGAFVRTVIPLAIPGIVAVIVFTFTLSAQEFIYALAFIFNLFLGRIISGFTMGAVKG